jgi:hypothetical protein
MVSRQPDPDDDVDVNVDVDVANIDWLDLDPQEDIGSSGEDFCEP